MILSLIIIFVLVHVSEQNSIHLDCQIKATSQPLLADVGAVFTATCNSSPSDLCTMFKHRYYVRTSNLKVTVDEAVLVTLLCDSQKCHCDEIFIPRKRNMVLGNNCSITKSDSATRYSKDNDRDYDIDDIGGNQPNAPACPPTIPPPPIPSGTTKLAPTSTMTTTSSMTMSSTIDPTTIDETLTIPPIAKDDHCSYSLASTTIKEIMGIAAVTTAGNMVIFAVMVVMYKKLKKKHNGMKVLPIPNHLTKLKSPVQATKPAKKTANTQISSSCENRTTGTDDSISARSKTIHTSQKGGKSMTATVDLGPDTSEIKSMGPLFLQAQQAKDGKDSKPVLMQPDHLLTTSRLITIDTDIPSKTPNEMNSRAEEWESNENQNITDLPIEILKRILRHKKKASGKLKA